MCQFGLFIKRNNVLLVVHHRCFEIVSFRICSQTPQTNILLSSCIVIKTKIKFGNSIPIIQQGRLNAWVQWALARGPNKPPQV